MWVPNPCCCKRSGIANRRNARPASTHKALCHDYLDKCTADLLPYRAVIKHAAKNLNISRIRETLGQLEHRLDALPLKGERYAICLDSYEGASNQRRQILAWMRRVLLPQCSKERLTVLSVGCGTGDLDKAILSAGIEHAGTVSYVGLEPDAAQCERFVRQMTPAETDNVKVEAFNTGFEDFREQRNFDLVLMVHSLYYMPDPAIAIDQALRLLSEGGRLVVLLAENDTLNELSSSFWQLEADRTAWFSQDLCAYLDQQGLAFTREQIEARLDVTPCFDADSATGLEIADFLAQVSTSELPESLQGMIREYLDTTSRYGEAGRWLPHNVDAFVIPAPAKN